MSIMRVKMKFEGQLMQLPNVTGVSIGEKAQPIWLDKGSVSFSQPLQRSFFQFQYKSKNSLSA